MKDGEKVWQSQDDGLNQSMSIRNSRDPDYSKWIRRTILKIAVILLLSILLFSLLFVWVSDSSEKDFSDIPEGLEWVYSAEDYHFLCRGRDSCLTIRYRSSEGPSDSFFLSWCVMAVPQIDKGEDGSLVVSLPDCKGYITRVRIYQSDMQAEE